MRQFEAGHVILDSYHKSFHFDMVSGQPSGESAIAYLVDTWVIGRMLNAWDLTKRFDILNCH